jgi:3-hydroxybutyryl-CoA dehydrogenase
VSITDVAVVGAGYMGGGIAQVLAIGGFRVAITDADAATTRRNLDRIRQEARTFEEQGLFDPGWADLVEANVWAAGSLEEAVGEADFVEEAVLEAPAVKGPVLTAIEAVARPDAVIASNTSTLPISGLAVHLQHPARFLGVHFSNPAPFIPGVELIAHAGTDESAVVAAEEVVARTGKLSARVVDQAGFVLNRLQYALLKEAATLVEEGVATAEDVDVVVRTTFGYRLPFFGPFAIADMAGLDIYAAGFGTLTEHYGDRFATPAVLTELVQSGHLGVKQDGGFVIPAGDSAPLVAYRNRAYARLGQLLRELGPAPTVGKDRTTPDALATPAAPAATEEEQR